VKKWIRSNGTTAGAILIALALTTVFAFIAVYSWLAAIYPDRMDPSFARNAGSAGSASASNASGMIAIAMGAVVLVSAIIVIGLIFRRAWAREAAFVIYGFLSLLVLAASVGGLMADPPARSPWTGILVGISNLAIVLLLMAPATSRVFSGRPANRLIGDL
jgi:hypothetical protein